METVELKCERRQTGTKHLSKALRRNGEVPGVLYGPNTQSIPVTLSGAELRARVAAAARQRLIKLRSADAGLNSRHVIIKQVQRAPIKGDLLHADLLEVDLNKPLRVSVPIHLSGRARGVADGGVLQPLLRQILVECLPLEIPEHIEVDVSGLGIHEAIHLSDVTLSGNVKAVFDTDEAVVTVLPPTVEAAPVAAAAEAEAEPAAAGTPAAAPAAAAGTEQTAKKAEAGKKSEAGKK